MTRSILIALLVAFTFSLVVQAKPAQQQDEKSVLFEKFESNKRGDVEQQKVAFDTAKYYLQKFSADDPRTQEMRKFVAGYERILELDNNLKLKNYAKVVELGRQFLQSDPDKV